MKRDELIFSYFNTLQTSLLNGIFFMVYLLVFLVASFITIMFFAIGLYLFAIAILGFLFTISIIAGMKMRSLNKRANKIRETIRKLGYKKR